MLALTPEPIMPAVDALMGAMTAADRPFYADTVSLFEQRVAALEHDPAVPAAAPASGWKRPFAAG